METGLLLLLLQCLSWPAAAEYWQQQRDDLGEYLLDRSAANVRSEIECTTMAESKHQAVQFSQSDGTCSMYICQLGSSGCRKCRNARNYSMPRLQVRFLDQLGRSCWRTFQHRVDGSVDFYRNWTEHLTEFGQGEDFNYWMGLEAIHQLTVAANRRARWEMSMWNGSWWWWENLFFAVQGADLGYRATLGSQDNASSNIILITYPWTSLDKQNFSTLDKDQDSTAEHFCATKYHSGWWHNSCSAFNPNGKYYTPPTAYQLTTEDLWGTGLTFLSISDTYPFNLQYSMKTVECLVTDFASNMS